MHRCACGPRGAEPSRLPPVAAAGNWTAYWPNELVCDTCATCASPRANQVGGHSFIRLDDGTYAACDNPDDSSWVALSATSRRYGAACTYLSPCFEWTGTRPYSEPSLDVGSGVVSRAVPSGRYYHAAALALNRDTGERDTMILFGGFSTDCTDYCNDTWHYSLPNNQWAKVRSAAQAKTEAQPVLSADAPAAPLPPPPLQPTMGASPSRRWKHAMADYQDTVYLVRPRRRLPRCCARLAC